MDNNYKRETFFHALEQLLHLVILLGDLKAQIKIDNFLSRLMLNTYRSCARIHKHQNMCFLHPTCFCALSHKDAPLVHTIIYNRIGNHVYIKLHSFPQIHIFPWSHSNVFLAQADRLGLGIVLPTSSIKHLFYRGLWGTYIKVTLESMRRGAELACE
jgi:hypothetical protein